MNIMSYKRKLELNKEYPFYSELWELIAGDTSVGIPSIEPLKAYEIIYKELLNGENHLINDLKKSFEYVQNEINEHNKWINQYLMEIEENDKRR